MKIYNVKMSNDKKMSFKFRPLSELIFTFKSENAIRH